MKKQAILLLSLCLLGVFSLYAQDPIQLSGYVTNELNGEAVPDHEVNIMINDTSLFYSTVSTNQNGFYIDTIQPMGGIINSVYIYTLDLCTYGVHDTLVNNPGSGITADFEICVDSITNPDCQSDFYSVPDSSNPYTILFFDNSTSNLGVNSWFWEFGDGTTSSLQSPAHTYNANGTYSVCLTITADSMSCVSVSCQDVVINAGGGGNCEADFYYVADSIMDGTVYFYDQSAPANVIDIWTWSFGDGTTSNQQNPVHQYAAPGTYNVCLTIETLDSGMMCTDTYCMDVVVTGSGLDCEADFFFINDSTPDNTVYFYDQSTPANVIDIWTWSFGDGTTSNQQDPVHQYAAPGTYNVCLTIETLDSGMMCTDTYCMDVVVTGSGLDCEADFFYIIDSTLDYTVNFYDQSTPSNGIVSFFWDFGDGTTSLLQNPVHTYGGPGNYIVCLTIESQSSGMVCTDAMCTVVTLTGGGTNCFANFYYTYDSLGGNSNTVNFYDVSTPAGLIDTWSWSFGDGSTSSEQNPVHTYSSPGTYGVCLTITADSGACTSYHCDTIIISGGQQYQLGGNVFAGIYQLDNGFAYAYQSDNGTITNVFSDILDTLGYYLFYPMVTADYYVKVEPSPNSAYAGQYMPTYYGDAVTWANAVLIGVGQNVFTADINLVPMSQGAFGPGSIAGSVVHGSNLRGNSPAVDVQVMLKNEAGEFVGLAYTNEEGIFEFNSLPYGTFTLMAEEIGLSMIPKDFVISEDQEVIDGISMIMTDDEIYFGPSNIESLGDVTVSDIYPNPVIDVLRLDISIQNPTVVSYKVVNQLGQLMQSAQIRLEVDQTLEVNTSSFNSGVYFVEIITEDNFRLARRFVKL